MQTVYARVGEHVNYVKCSKNQITQIQCQMYISAYTIVPSIVWPLNIIDLGCNMIFTRVAINSVADVFYRVTVTQAIV